MLRLEKGEDVLPAIADFCKRKGILSASFRAIGAVEKAKIGYYDLPSKKYGSKEYRDAMEVASMTGNVAQVEEQGDASRYREASPCSSTCATLPVIEATSIASLYSLEPYFLEGRS